MSTLTYMSMFNFITHTSVMMQYETNAFSMSASCAFSLLGRHGVTWTRATNVVTSRLKCECHEAQAFLARIQLGGIGIIKRKDDRRIETEKL